MSEIKLPVGRLVGGHPMVQHPQMDDKTGQPKTFKDNVTPLMSIYVGYAIPKGAETDWRQTEWGQQMQAGVLAAWPNGEHAMPAFSWKVEDGDSQVPNKKMKKPCEREGWPGHWVLHASKPFPFNCYRRGQYEPHQAIQRKEEIKTGDYCRMLIDYKGNNATGTNTPGMYMNPVMFELYQAGVQIMTENTPDACAVWGDDAGVLPQGAVVDPDIPASVTQLPGSAGTPPPPPQQHKAILAPPAKRLLNGVAYDESTLATSGYSPEQIAALPAVV